MYYITEDQFNSLKNSATKSQVTILREIQRQIVKDLDEFSHDLQYEAIEDHPNFDMDEFLNKE